jgi:hypothetical protein
LAGLPKCHNRWEFNCPITRFWQFTNLFSVSPCLRASVVGLFYPPICGATSPVSGTSTASCESLSTDSGRTISNPCPHLGQTTCWVPEEIVEVLRTGNESPYGHTMNVMSPAAMILLFSSLGLVSWVSNFWVSNLKTGAVRARRSFRAFYGVYDSLSIQWQQVTVVILRCLTRDSPSVLKEMHLRVPKVARVKKLGDCSAYRDDEERPREGLRWKTAQGLMQISNFIRPLICLIVDCHALVQGILLKDL